MGDLKQIYVQVGGLCMITEFENQLRILMPAANHDGMRHCPYLHVPQEFDGGGAMKPLGTTWSTRVLDLSGLKANGTSQPFKGLGLVVEASALNNDSKVQERFLKRRPNKTDLLARVHLPLASQPFVGLGEKADLTCKGSSGEVPLSGYGRIGILIQVTEDIDVLEIPMLNLSITPIDNRVEITLLNIRPKDWGKEDETIKAGDYLQHLDSYFHMLDQNKLCSIHSGKAHGKVPSRPGDTSCDEIGYKDFPRWPVPTVIRGQPQPIQIQGIDPYNCTVGGGCPNGAC